LDLEKNRNGERKKEKITKRGGGKVKLAVGFKQENIIRL